MSGVFDVRLRGALALLGAAALFGSFGVLIRILDTLFGEKTQVAVRFAVATVLLVGIILWWGNRSAIAQVLREHLWRALGLAVVFGVEAIFFTVSVNRTTLANTVFLSYAGAIITSLTIAILLFGEQMTLTKAVAMVIALAGLAMYGGSLASFSVGVLAGLAAGILDGVVNGLRKSLKGADRSAVLMVQYGVGALVVMLLALLVSERFIRTESAGSTDMVGPLLVALVFGISLVGIGYLLLYGFSHFELNAATILLTTEIGFAALFGLIFYGEVPSLTEAIGGVLVFAAATVAVLERVSPFIPVEVNVPTSVRNG